MTHEPMQVSAHMRLPAAPTAPRRARKFLRAALSSLEVSEDLSDTVALLTSELVTNAVIHGRSDVDLRLNWPAGKLRISVSDENARHPLPGDLHDLEALSGRGLAIVEELAGEWGITDVDGGKEIWFSVEIVS